MVNWNRFVVKDFDDDESIREKLSHHGIRFEEAMQCFYNPFQVRKNKKFKDLFQLIGKTDGGRHLKIIFQLKHANHIRIITGWDL